MTPKYCPNCGSKLVSGATFCAKCGHQVRSSGGEISSDQHIAKEERSNAFEIKTNMVGINGWLLLFTIGSFVGIISKIISIAGLFGYMADASDGYGAFLLIGVAGEITVVCLIIAYLVTLFSRLKVAKILAVAFLAFNLVFLLVFTWLVDSIIKSAGGDVPTDLWGTVTSAVVTASIWIPYFLVSKRVKGTLTK